MGFFKKIKNKFKKKKSLDIDINNEDIDLNLLSDHLTNLMQEDNELSKKIQQKRNAVMDLKHLDEMTDEEEIQFSRALNSIQNAKSEKDIVKRQLNKIHLEKIPDSFYDNFEDTLKELKKAEEKQRLAKSDMDYLEGEKGYLEYQKEKYEKVLKTMRYIGIFISVFVGIAILILAVLYATFSKTFILPVVILFAITLFSISWIYIWKRNITYAMKMNIKKQEKAKELLNKAKIKYARHTNYLNFTYNKYNVENLNKLINLWEEFNLFRDTNKQYQDLRKYETSVLSNIEFVFQKYNITEDEYLLNESEHIINKGQRETFMKALQETINEEAAQLKNIKAEQNKYWKMIYHLKSSNIALSKEIDKMIEEKLI